MKYNRRLRSGGWFYIESVKGWQYPRLIKGVFGSWVLTIGPVIIGCWH